jgi:kynureninase
VADSTSINLYKTVNAALRLREDRRAVVAEIGNFPTDAYVLQGIAKRPGDAAELRACERGDVAGAIDSDTAVVVLTHVHYRDCAAFDMQAITRRAHEAGALVVWDLSHSVGAVSLDLAAADVDFAVGCTYKYLNGGPGAPAFIYAAGRHHDALDPGMVGWWGHRSPFEMLEEYSPAAGMRRMLTGTASIIALAALDGALDVFDGVAMSDVRAKSIGLTSAFMELVQSKCAGFGVEIMTPADPESRGSHVALRHEQGYAIMQALIARGVVGDFRAPDVMRFGFAPLYVSYRDVCESVEVLADVLSREEWRRPEFSQRSRVT